MSAALTLNTQLSNSTNATADGNSVTLVQTTHVTSVNPADGEENLNSVNTTVKISFQEFSNLVAFARMAGWKQERAKRN